MMAHLWKTHLMTPSNIHQTSKSSSRILQNRENILPLFSCSLFLPGVLWLNLSKQMCFGGAGRPFRCTLVSPPLPSDWAPHPEKGTLRDVCVCMCVCVCVCIRGVFCSFFLSGHMLAWGAVLAWRREKATGRKMRLKTFIRINNCDTTPPEGLQIHIPRRTAAVDKHPSIHPSIHLLWYLECIQ